MPEANGRPVDGRGPEWRGYLRLDARPEVGQPDALPSSGQDGWIELIAWNLAIDSPRDAASGLPTGKRQHPPLVVAKPIDRSSSRLMASLVDGEIMEELVLEIWRSSRDRAERGRVSADDLLDRPYDEAFEIYRQRLEESRRSVVRDLTVRLDKARVVGIETEMPNAAWLGGAIQEPHERISFACDRITWTWHREGEEDSVTRRWPRGSDARDPLDTPDRLPAIVVRARESANGKKVWAVASAAGPGEAKKPKHGSRPASGVELSYAFKYESKAPKLVGSCATDKDGTALIQLPGSPDRMPSGRYRFIVIGAKRNAKPLELAGNRKTGWLLP